MEKLSRSNAKNRYVGNSLRIVKRDMGLVVPLSNTGGSGGKWGGPSVAVGAGVGGATPGLVVPPGNTGGSGGR